MPCFRASHSTCVTYSTLYKKLQTIATAAIFDFFHVLMPLNVDLMIRKLFDSKLVDLPASSQTPAVHKTYRNYKKNEVNCKPCSTLDKD